MNDTAHPAALAETLEHLGLSEMLTGYIKRQDVTRRVSWHEFERFAQGLGYRVRLEHGNLYGRVGLERISTTPAAKLRLIVRSDHAAVHGSKRRAA
jgi:hypothetical protein